MTDDEEDREAEHSVDSIFADYVTRVEAGEELDFESFVERHTELESGLRELHGAWVRVRDVLDRLGLSAALSRTRAGFTTVLSSGENPETCHSSTSLSKLIPALLIPSAIANPMPRRISGSPSCRSGSPIVALKPSTGSIK